MPTPVPDARLELRLAARDRARAEAREWAAMVSFRDGALARLDPDVNRKRRQLERSAVNLEIARELHMSEGQVMNLLASADRVLEHAPLAWAAFRAGQIDGARVREISLTVEKLVRDDSIQRLDDEAPTYARTHTVGELRRWGRRARWRSPVQRLRRCRASRGRASLASLDTWCRPTTAWPGCTPTSLLTTRRPSRTA